MMNSTGVAEPTKTDEYTTTSTKSSTARYTVPLKNGLDDRDVKFAKVVLLVDTTPCWALNSPADMKCTEME